MRNCFGALVVGVCGLEMTATPLSAQLRVTPERSAGGTPFGEPWAVVPESFRDLGVPEWPVPTDLKQWHEVDRPRTRETLVRLLGELPPRPDPAAVKILSREDRGPFILERFEFFNGVDMTVPGILAIPKNRKRPAPVIIGMHGHSGSKEDYVPDPENERSLGWMLVQRGYAVAAIDFFVRLIDVRPAGLARDVSLGMVRARYRNGLDKPAPTFPITTATTIRRPTRTPTRSWCRPNGRSTTARRMLPGSFCRRCRTLRSSSERAMNALHQGR